MRPTRAVRSLLALTPLVSLACASAGRGSDTFYFQDRELGTYEFRGRVESLAFEGKFTILPAVVAMTDMTTGACTLQPDTSRAFAFRCGDITVSIPRHDPLVRSTFQATVMVPVKRSVCLRYGVDSRGREVCAQMGTETIEQRALRYGTITPVRVTSAR